MAEFNFKGVWIPAKVFTDPRLTHSDKFLFALVHILSNERGCFATRETLSTYMCQSVRNTQYSISRLCEFGYIRKEENGTLWDIITQSIEGEEICTPTVKNSSLEGRKKLHPYSNKDIVITEVKGDVQINDSFIRSNKQLSDAWDAWIVRRKQKRQTTSPGYIEGWNTKFSEWGVEKALESIRLSTLQGWQGLFEPKAGIHVPLKAPKTGIDHSKGF